MSGIGRRDGVATIAILWLLLIAVLDNHAQKQANNWYFGEYAGITFNTPGGQPIAVTNGALQTNEGCATISDASGNLLFYSDGVQAWNRNHTILLNSENLLGNASATQSCIVIPKPGSDRLYYLFTVPIQYPNNGLCYSLVDMELDGGLGGIPENEKNILLQPNVTEKVTAVKHANNIDFWVITHERNNNIFDAFLVSSEGINKTPVKSSIGSVHLTLGGYLKASPDGTRIACAVSIPSFVEVFHFNTNTGIISSPIILFTASLSVSYGLEFSPNSQLIYMSNMTNGNIYQANLSLGDSTSIVNSLSFIAGNPTSGAGAIQLGPDGKLYISFPWETALSVIQNPNVAGTGCGFVYQAIDLAGRRAELGLPTFIQSYFNPLPFTYKYVCFGDTTEFTPEQTTGYDSLLWNFGDPASAPYDTSSLTSPTHIFTAPGTYTVSLTTWSGGNSAVITQEVKINPLPQPNLGTDTTLCGGSALVLALGETYMEYLWSDGSTGKTLIVTTTGTYTVTVTDGNGCQGSDGIQVEFHAVPGPVPIRHDE